VEGTELWGQPTKCPDERQLGGDLVRDETEPDFLRELEALLGFALHLRERFPRREEVGDQVVAAVSRKGQITNFVGRIEGAAHEVASRPDVSRPGQDDISERHIGSSLKTLQSAFLHQVVTKPSESRSGVVVAETGTCDDRKPHVSEARPVTVSMLETQIDD